MRATDAKSTIPMTGESVPGAGLTSRPALAGSSATPSYGTIVRTRQHTKHKSVEERRWHDIRSRYYDARRASGVSNSE